MSRMKIAIIGAGAIGGFVGAQLAHAGEDVTFIARGATLEAHQVAAVAAEVPKLFAAHTVVVPMQNGIPFWYFHKHGGVLEGRAVTSVDPNGVIGKNIPCERVIGCVVYPASELLAPAVIKQIEGNRFPVGDLDGTQSERVTRV